MGDPQTTRERLFRVLDAHGILGDDGMLADDAALISIGDHFDFGSAERGVTGREGLGNLRWLAAHPRDQVVILAGNHDLSRLMELGLETDASFEAAHALAMRIRDAETAGEDADPLEAAFATAFPNIATPELAYRDYASFTEAQRRTVAALVLSGRMELGRALRLPSGEPVLLTHAAVTAREVEILGLPLESPRRDDRRRAERLFAPRSRRCSRDLGAGGTRATRPRAAPRRWSLGPRRRRAALPSPCQSLAARGPSLVGVPDARAPRRFDPRTLPPGLIQACGHSAHRKSSEGARRLGLRVGPARRAHVYGRSRLAATTCATRRRASILPREGEATLYLIDAEMNIADPASYPLFRLGPLTA